MLYAVAAVVLVQVGIPAYLGFRYLGKLAAAPAPGPVTPQSTPLSASHGSRESTYTDSPFPFGIVGTFVPMVLILILGTFTGVALAGPEIMPFIFIPLFFAVFIGPALFNRRMSPFERSRTLIDSFTGGGSIFLFHGSWPFFRLLVYRDALEVRVMYHRFLIPFDMMEELPETVGFFSSGIPIRSNLPGVPSCIRFNGFGSNRIAKSLHGAQQACLAGRSGARTP
jgi:hypothetical protein